MIFIKVWCEYDFGGQFGGNNNQEVFSIPENLSISEVDAIVRKYLVSSTGVPEEDLDEDLYGWEDITVSYLGEDDE